MSFLSPRGIDLTKLTRFGSSLSSKAPESNFQEEKLGDKDHRLSKLFIENKPEKDIFCTILFNKVKTIENGEKVENCEKTLGVHSVKYERISTFPDLLDLLHHVKRAQATLLTQFEKHPKVLLMIFQRQLEEIDRFLAEGFKTHLERRTQENSSNITLFGRKIYYLVSKINKLMVRLHQSIAEYEIPKRILHFFPDVQLLSYIPHSDSKAAGIVLRFLQEEKRSKLWELRDRVDLYQYFDPEGNSYRLGQQLPELNGNDLQRVEYLDLDSFIQSFSQLNIKDIKHSEKIKENVKKFTKLSYIRLGKRCNSKLSFEVVQCFRATKEKLHGDFSGSPVITDTDLHFAAPFTTLNVSGTNVRGDFLEGKSVSGLQKLQLRECKKFDESNFKLASFVSRKQVIKKGKDTKDAVKKMVRYETKFFSTLQELDVSKTSVTGSLFPPQLLTSLTYLNMDGCPIDEKAFLKFQKKQLLKVNFSNTTIRGDCFGPLFETVRHLTLENCQILLEGGLEKLSPNLTHLNISGSKVNGMFLKKLNPQYLAELKMGFCSQIQDQHLKNIKSPITILDLQSTYITGECFDTFKDVEELNLANCSNLDEKYLCKLPLDKIRKLNLSGTAITGNFLKVMPELEELSLAGCKKLQEGLLSNLIAKKLKIFNLNDTPFTGSSLGESTFRLVEDLYIEGTDVTDENLQTLSIHKVEKKESNVKKISLLRLKASRTKLTGEFLKNESFRYIEEIELFSCPKLEGEMIPDTLKNVVVSDQKIESFEFV